MSHDPFGLLGDDFGNVTGSGKKKKKSKPKPKPGQLSEAEAVHWEDYWKDERRKDLLKRIIDNI
jgi:hypothetical protein